ncbi:glycosyltransferase family 2 protein [Allofournierella sp.]|uniref:glycosyltransferase family 2 protein n=1 Tax=Allofournierella sp. TaxID=1940256 RepID=UPI003AB4A69D
MSSPLISMIVPVYNVEAYLSRCLESITAQTLGDFECILVDDGSTDSSSPPGAARRSKAVFPSPSPGGFWPSAGNIASGRPCGFVRTTALFAPRSFWRATATSPGI